MLLAAVGRCGRPGESADSIGRQQLHEVVVTGQSALTRISSVRMGAETLELTKLASAPDLFGESDIIKAITLMPGVHSEGEGAGGFEVRGGTASQNLVTLDGIAMYNPSHVMGIFSTFNEMPYDDVAVLQVTFDDTPGEYGECYWVRLYRNGEPYKWSIVTDILAVDGRFLPRLFPRLARVEGVGHLPSRRDYAAGLTRSAVSTEPCRSCRPTARMRVWRVILRCVSSGLRGRPLACRADGR